MQSRVERAAQARKGVRSRHAVKGHEIGYTTDPASGKIHMTGSMMTQLSAGERLEDGIRRENVRYSKIAGRGRRNLLFLIDTSGSMLSTERLAIVKGCVVSLLEDAYVKRIRVALVGYGGARARLILPFTASPEMAARRIEEMKGGGSTPLVQALGIAGSFADTIQDESLEIILLSDGRYDRSRTGRETRQIREFGEYCRKKKIPISLIDSGSGGKTAAGRAMQLAARLHALYRPIEDLRADAILQDERS